jgi:hypothetical protein
MGKRLSGADSEDDEEEDNDGISFNNDSDDFLGSGGFY